MKPDIDRRHDGTLPDGTPTDEQVRRFRAAMDMSGDAIYLVDRATMRFVDLNQTACTRTGYTREELLRMGPQDLIKTSRESLERDYDEVIAAGEQGITTESTAHYKDGRKSQAELHRRALRTDDGWIIVSIARDITERKRAERASRQIGRMYAALSATNEAILRARLPEELYQQVCDAAVFGGKLISTSVLVPGPDGSSLEVVAIAGRGEEQLRGTHISVDESIAEGRNLVGIAFRTLQPCVSNDYLNDERTRLWHETARAAGVRAGAAVPLVRGGRAAGVLLFYSDEKGAFDEEVVKLLQRMAENIVFALDNFEREADRKRAEKALRESEEKFRITLESIEEAYFEVDLTGNLVFLNAAFCRLLGYSEHELIGMNNQRYQSPEVAARVFETFNEVYRTGAPKIGHDWELIRKDGSKVLVEASVNLIRDSQGKATGFRGMLRDVTARREAERRIEYLATHDELTGLPNRVMFGELLKLAIESARRHERRFAVLFIDLDGFKTVNDTLGHEAGDALLKRISARLKDCLRASDVVARQGGDEFVVLVEEVTDTGEVTAVARKILAGVIESASLAGHDCGVTASVGISMYPADARDEKSLMKSADIAMYLAKERGKNNFQFVSSSIEMPGDPLRSMAR